MGHVVPSLLKKIMKRPFRIENIFLCVCVFSDTSVCLNMLQAGTAALENVQILWDGSD